MALLGIMQGRLVPPVDGRFQCFPRGHWQKEFPLAAQAKLDTIEWIYDAFGADENPLATDAGIEQILALAARYHVQVKSLCADWFMDFPLVHTTPLQATQRVEHLCWLLGQCRKAGIQRVVLPFVDASKIDNARDMHSVLSALKQVLPTLEKSLIEIHLETSLAPTKFAELLAKIPHPLVKVNYDSGNSASLGYDVREEFAAYGERIGSVHLKDRLQGAGTVPLGQGDADFPTLFKCLKSIHYCGDFILQVARGVEGDEMAWTQHNIEFVKPYVQPRRLR